MIITHNIVLFIVIIGLPFMINHFILHPQVTGRNYTMRTHKMPKRTMHKDLNPPRSSDSDYEYVSMSTRCLSDLLILLAHSSTKLLIFWPSWLLIILLFPLNLLLFSVAHLPHLAFLWYYFFHIFTHLL